MIGHMTRDFCERIQWSGKEYSLNELLQRFGDQFPIIARTVSGFHGANEAEVISAGEVIRIHSVATQWRVFARGVRGHIFCLPLNFPVKFEAIKKRGRKSKPKFLDEILEDYELPVRVSLAKDIYSFNVGEMRYNSATIGVLTLYKVYEERFLRMNSISKGVINKHVVLLPLYIEVHVNVAKGFYNDETGDDWNSLMQMYDQSISLTRIMAANGLDEVLVYDPAEGEVLNPQAVIEYTSKRQTHVGLPPPMPLGTFNHSGQKTNMAGTGRPFPVRPIFGGNIDGKRKNNTFQDQYGANPSYVIQVNHPSVENTTAYYNFGMTDPQIDELDSVDQEGQRSHQRNAKMTESKVIGLIDTRLKPDIDSRHEMGLRASEVNSVFEDAAKQNENNFSVVARVGIQNGEVRVYSRSETNGFEEGKVSPIKPLTVSIVPKRPSVPMGRVSPIVKWNSIGNVADNVIVEHQTEQRTHKELDDESYHSARLNNVNETLANNLHRSLTVESDTFSEAVMEDAGIRVPSNTEKFSDPENNSVMGAVAHSEIRSPVISKSALKAGRRRSMRPKRHVSYSDTDTVYPFDSTEDTADDSELDDNPFRPGAGTIFVGNMRNRTKIANIRDPPSTWKRQNASIVGVLPPSDFGRRNTSTLGLPRPVSRKHFYGSDTDVSKSSLSLRYPGIEVIPESAEEYTRITNGSRPRQYGGDWPVNNGPRSIDTHRKYSSSVVNLGNARNDTGTLPRGRRHNGRSNTTETAMLNTGSRNFLVHDNETQRRRTHVGIVNVQNGRASTIDWRQNAYPRRNIDNNEQTFGTILKNGQSPQMTSVADYSRQTINFKSHPGNHSTVLTNSNLVRLNEARLKTADEFASSNTNRGATFMYTPTAGLVSTVAVQNSEKSGIQAKTYGVPRETYSMATLPRIAARDNHQRRNVGVVTPIVLERNRPTKKLSTYVHT